MVNKNVKQYNSFFCPACGSDMKRDAASGQLICPTCGHTESACIDDVDHVTFDFAAAEQDPALNDWGVPVQTTTCPACGVKMVVTAAEGVSRCAFCAAEPVIAVDDPPGVRPDSIIPFKIDEANARERVSKWINQRFLAPFSFKSHYAAGPLMGVYLPYWSFDAHVNATYTGQVASSYTDTEINTVTSKERTDTKERKVRKLRWRFVSGKLEKRFSNVIFNDVEQLDAGALEKLEPFKLNELIKFAPKYLEGFSAEHCKNGLEAVWKRALGYMGGTLRTEIHNTVKRGSDVVGAVKTCADYSDIAFRQLLLPVWIGPYRYKNKIYHVYINGQTGVLFGRFPISILKIGIIALIAAAVIAALVFLIK